jgi:hypothetical protein
MDIPVKERIRVKIEGFDYRENSNDKQTNPYCILVKNYHKKCYLERYKDYQILKGEKV